MRSSFLVSIFFLAATTIASELAYDRVLPTSIPDLDVRQSTACGAINGKCNENGCNGFNDPDTGGGICLSGDSIQGCPCDSVCGEISGSCDKAGCDGINDPNGEPGICTSGDFKGCQCASVCNDSINDCDKNGCEGINSPNGMNGFCTAGKFKGCLCNSVCKDKNGKCDENNCAGVDGICTSGGAKGCPCDPGDGAQNCGNLSVGKCSDSGCNGSTDPNDGLGICNGGGAIQGCPCIP